MAQQRLPIVNSDDGVWGDILRQYLMKEHYNNDTDNAANGGHQFVTIRPGTTTAAPLTLTSGSLLSTPAIGAIEFNNDTLYFTKTTGATRMQLVADTATQTLTNKTLTAPKIDGIKDTSGNNVLVFNAAASAVNYLTMSNRATGSLPYLAADGADTNVDLGLIPKGTGRVAIWKSSGAAEINGGGGDTNVDLNLSTQGTGVVKANNVQVATISDAQTLTNKTLTAPKINQVNDTSGNQQFTTSPTDMIMAVDLDMEGRFVWNIHDPTDAQDATSKIYVDNLVIAERTAAATLTNKTLSNPTVTNYTEQTFAIGTVTTAATISLANGTVQTATLTASTACTFTMPAVAAGKSFVLFLKQAASTGLGTATFTGVKWPGGTAPTITPTAGQMDILTFTSDGTNWYGTFIQGFTP
jgi:hypothetical protein